MKVSTKSLRIVSIALGLLITFRECSCDQVRQEGCTINANSLRHGTLWMYGHPLDPRVLTGVREGIRIQFQCTESGYEIYVDGQPNQKAVDQSQVEDKTCRDGKLQGPNIECLPARCSCDDSATKLRLKSQRLQFEGCSGFVESGDFIQVRCERTQDGRPQGQQEIECHMGAWEQIEAKCQSEGSCRVPDIRNAVFHHEENQVFALQSLQHGSVTELTCEAGYFPVQRNSLANDEKILLSCNDAKWSHEEITCAPVQCSCDMLFATSLLRRYMKPGKCEGMVNHGEVVDLECSYEGMLMKQPGFILCDSGEWRFPEDENVRCVAGMRKCVVPDIENAIFHVDFKQVYQGDSIIHGKINAITCDDGYSPAHMSSIHSEKLQTSCDNGQWSHKDVSCVPAQCSCQQLRDTGLIQRFVIPGTCSGKVNHGHAIGLECRYARMTMQKGGSIRCEYGEWIYPDDQDVRCIQSLLNCTVPETKNAFFHVDSHQLFGGQIVAHGKAAEVMCDDGYSPSDQSSRYVGNILITCNDGKWTPGEISCSPAQCDCTNIFSSDMTRRYLKEGQCEGIVNHGHRVAVECRYPGSILKKEGFIKCELGMWIYPEDSDVRCFAIPRNHSCALPHIENAVFHHKSGEMRAGQLIEHKLTAEVTCIDGYTPAHVLKMQDKVVISCDNGQWSHDKVSCLPAKCNCQSISRRWLMPRYLEADMKCTGSMDHGDTISINCSHAATILKKQGVITCHFGKWNYPNDNDVRCVPRPCSVKPGQFHNANLFIDNELVDLNKTLTINHGTRLSLECSNPGYEIYKDGAPFKEPDEEKDNPEIICLSGVLIGRRTECRPARCSCSCLTEKLQERHLEEDQCEHLVKNGESVQVECEEGFVSPKAPLSVECDSGKWLLPPDVKCERIRIAPPKGCTIFQNQFPNTNLFKDGEQLSLDKPLSIRHGTKLGLSCESTAYELYLDGFPFGDPEDEFSYAELLCFNGTIKGSNTECRPARCSCAKLDDALSRNRLQPYNCADNIQSGGAASAICWEGYTSEERMPVRATCQSGKWKVPRASCERAIITSTTTKSPELETCIYLRKSGLIASYKNVKITEPKPSFFSEGDRLKFRCSDITKYKLEGSNNRTCTRGAWSNDEPKCTVLRLRNRASAPVITYELSDGDSLVSSYGVLHVTTGASITFNCHWFQDFGYPIWRAEDPHVVAAYPKWNYNKDTYSLELSDLQEKHSGRYSCTNPYGKTHSIIIKVQRYLHEEPDRVAPPRPTDSPDVTTARPIVPVTRPEEPVTARPPVAPVTARPPVAPVTARPPVERISCRSSVWDRNILHFYKGRQIDEFMEEFPIGAVITHRCDKITNFNFSGSIQQICTSQGWSGVKPKCTELKLRNLHGAPITEYVVEDGHSSIAEDGTLLVSPGSTISLHCLWFRSRGNPKWTAENPAAVRKYPAWNTNGDSFELELTDVEEKHSGSYTCTNPYRKAQTIRIRITDSGELDNMN